MTTIEPWLREILVCPQCHAALADGADPAGRPELRCTDPECALVYRVEDGIPVLLVSEATRRAQAPGSAGGAEQG